MDLELADLAKRDGRMDGRTDGRTDGQTGLQGCVDTSKKLQTKRDKTKE